MDSGLPQFQDGIKVCDLSDGDCRDGLTGASGIGKVRRSPVTILKLSPADIPRSWY